MLVPTTATRPRTGRNRPGRRSDPDLIDACLRGDETAWDELVEQYGRLVYSIARRYSLSDADADDVFQSVFVTVFERLDFLRDHERFSAWLITTTYRQCCRSGRRATRMSDVDERIVDASEPSDELVDSWERQHLVRRALETLGSRYELLLRTLFDEPDPPSYETSSIVSV